MGEDVEAWGRKMQHPKKTGIKDDSEERGENSERGRNKERGIWARAGNHI